MDNSTSREAGSLPSATELCFERFLVVWQGSKALSGQLPLIVFLVGLILIFGTTVFIGAVPIRQYGHDVFIPLDSGWRVINGQRPHLDFTSAWGPVWFLIAGLGLTISRHSVNGIGYANAIMALMVGTWSFLLGKNRLAPSSRIILSLFLAAFVATPYALGDPFHISSHAMVYNRYGYALLALILLECLATVHAARCSQQEGWTGGLSTGAALSLTLFLKASFFLVGVVLVATISLVLRRVSRRRVLAIALGFCCVSLCLLWYLRFAVFAMLGDLRMAAGARAGGLSSDFVMRDALDHASVLLGVVLFAFAAALLFGNRVPQGRGFRLPLLGAFLFCADMALKSTNQQSGGFPLCAVFAILILNQVLKDQQSLPATEASTYRPLYAGALFLGALLFVPQFSSDLGGMAYGVWEKERPSNPADVLNFTSPNLRPLLLYDGADPRCNGKLFTAYVNDGVALLERQTRADESVLSIDMTNPFAYALERRPARGGIVSPAYHFDIDDTHRPADDRFFGDADIIMVPKHPSLGDLDFKDFLKDYEPGLQQRYYLAAQTTWWRMYRRK